MRTQVHEVFRLMPRVLKQSRSWHASQQYRYPMHPVIEAAFEHVDPADAAQLCLEWPYVALTDKTRLAFTANDAAGEADRQTLTSVGKYLKRHFPKLSDHVIRDLVAKYATASSYEVSTAMADIVGAVQNGPPSCMQWSSGNVSDLGAHPYETYAPIHGWAMAVRKDGAQINGRALVMQRDPDAKYFVRTYKRPDDPCARYSGPDEELTQWLQTNGYRKRDGWCGETLDYIEPSSGDYDFIAPYIDGSAQHVDESWCSTKRRKTLRITRGGEYQCTSQSGGYEGGNTCTCEDCNARIREDDRHTVGCGEDREVCDSCFDDYTYVHGRRGYEYYIPSDDAVCVDGEHYDPDYLSDNNITELHDGEYASMDNAVYVESQSEYWLMEDCVELPDGTWEVQADCVELHDGTYALSEDAVELHNGDWALHDDAVELHDGTYALHDDAWACAGSGEWYLNDDHEPVEIDDKTYHKDNVPETEEEIETTKEESC